MSERDGYRHGVPCRVASVHPDPERTVGFYTELFGWQATEMMGPDRWLTADFAEEDNR